MFNSGPLFTKWQDVSPPNLVKSQSREIGCNNDRIALCCQILERLEKSKTGISRLRDFTRSCSKTSVRLVNRGPEAKFSLGIVFIQLSSFSGTSHWYFCQHVAGNCSDHPWQLTMSNMDTSSGKLRNNESAKNTSDDKRKLFKYP